MKQKTVLLGLSGGVDSSVAALLLKNKGYKVIAAFMKNFSDTQNPLTKECNYLEDLKMAKRIANILNIDLIILDFENQYKKQVINQMFDDYKKGLTPNPDISCNTTIKFPLLWKEAKKLKADFIATGHYARIKQTKKGFHLLQGKDKTKDQSYFMSELNQKDLSHTLFPIGNLTKREVRKIAKKYKFPNHDKTGTRGICFIGKIDMHEFLKQKIKTKVGKILDEKGNEIGAHPGIFYYTIGQRVGPRLYVDIKKHLKEKYYIASKNKKNNTIAIAPQGHASLKKQEIKLIRFHKINPKNLILKDNLRCRIRHLGPLHKGKLSKHKNQFIFTFSRPVEQIAEGQQAVLYQNSELVASGEIRV